MRFASLFLGGALATLACSGIALPALADTPRLAPLRGVSMQYYGLSNPDCAEWTNGCQICRRDLSGAAQCSTPGIACTPKGVTCTTRAPAPAR